MEGWTLRNSYFLAVMTLGYVVGEIAHFLINTSSRAMAVDVHFGDMDCYLNTTYAGPASNVSCQDFKDESACRERSPECEWNYSGKGIQYQVLAGPTFVVVFTTFCIILGFASDKIRNSAFGRHRLMALGVFVFSLSCVLMGVTNAYWQVVVLRMGIAAGEAVCRPISAGMIADAFVPTTRSLPNGIFSWGIYFGYGLAYVMGINLTAANVLGYGWRASYVISGVPGIVIAFLLAVTLWDPVADDSGNGLQAVDSDDKESDGGSVNGSQREEEKPSFLEMFKLSWRTFMLPEMMLLLLAAIVRQTAGLTWAFNTRLYFQTYYPEFDTLSIWLLACSIGGGGFGVFFGGWFSDLLVKSLGLTSRLWVLGGFHLLSTPFAVLVLYLQPPYALVSLIAYYFCAETWFAVLFAAITEICEPKVKSATIAIFLFVMNNVGGNLPVIVDPVSKSIGYREAIYVLWPGCVALCGVLFTLASVPLMRRARTRGSSSPQSVHI